MKNFKSKVDVKTEKILIEISYKKRQYSSDPKFVFDEDIWSFIPEEYSGKVELISSPDKPVSNIGRNKYTQVGVWQFKLLKEPEKLSQSTQKKRQTQPRRKAKTSQQKARP